MILQLQFVYNQNTDSHGIYVAMQLHSADVRVRVRVCMCACPHREKIASNAFAEWIRNWEKLMAGDRRRGYHFFFPAASVIEVTGGARNRTRRLYRLRLFLPISKHFIVEPLMRSDNPIKRFSLIEKGIAYCRSPRVAVYLILFSMARHTHLISPSLSEVEWIIVIIV